MKAHPTGWRGSTSSWRERHSPLTYMTMTERRMPRIGRLWNPCQLSAAGTNTRAELNAAGTVVTMVPVGIEKVGAPEVGTRLRRQVHLHREQLGADVGMRLEREALAVLTVFEAQETAPEVEPAELLQPPHHDQVTETVR